MPTLKVMSIIDDDVAAVELFLNTGGDPNCNMYGQSPLVVAALQGKPRILKLLLERGARVNQIDDLGSNALHYAAWRGDVESVQLLLAAGISPNVINRDQNTPLQRALLTPIKDARMPVVKLLLAHGADPDLIGPGRRSPRSLVRDVLHDSELLAVIEQFKPL